MKRIATSPSTPPLLLAAVLGAGCGLETGSGENDAGRDSSPAASSDADTSAGSTTMPDDPSSSGDSAAPSTGDSSTGTTGPDDTDTGVGESSSGGMMPSAVPLHTIIYAAGPAWDPKLPPREQDLAAHFAYVAGLFEDGILLTNGPFLDDGRGFYVHLAEQAEDIDAIVAEDPAVQSGVLALDELGSWTLLLSQLGNDVGDDAFFVLHYGPGPGWTKGVPLAEQPGINEHLAYVGGAFGDGDLLAGGPIDDSSGRYIVALPDDAAATAFVAADPTVDGGLFEVQIKPWLPLQRQSVEDALAQ